MNITVHKKNNIAILDLEGNIDINTSNFIETIGQVLLKGNKEIICNFQKVKVIDYIGISIIAVAYKNILNHKGALKLIRVPPHIKKLFTVVGIDKVLETYENEDDALKSFKEDKLFSHILQKQLRRRFKRVPIKAKIEYRPKAFPYDSYYEGKILNMSAIGVFAIASQLFAVGEILASRIFLPLPQKILELDLKVVWIADKEIQPYRYPGMGLEFYNISSEKQKIIIGFVEKHLTRTAYE